jgi:hypothetical protein
VKTLQSEGTRIVMLTSCLWDSMNSISRAFEAQRLKGE